MLRGFELLEILLMVKKESNYWHSNIITSEPISIVKNSAVFVRGKNSVIINNKQ